MGVDVNIWRSRIGSFNYGCKSMSSNNVPENNVHLLIYIITKLYLIYLGIKTYFANIYKIKFQSLLKFRRIILSFAYGLIIGMLLLAAGIEANPGPNHSEYIKSSYTKGTTDGIEYENKIAMRIAQICIKRQYEFELVSNLLLNQGNNTTAMIFDDVICKINNENNKQILFLQSKLGAKNNESEYDVQLKKRSFKKSEQRNTVIKKFELIELRKYVDSYNITKEAIAGRNLNGEIHDSRRNKIFEVDFENTKKYFVHYTNKKLKFDKKFIEEYTFTREECFYDALFKKNSKVWKLKPAVLEYCGINDSNGKEFLENFLIMSGQYSLPELNDKIENDVTVPHYLNETKKGLFEKSYATFKQYLEEAKNISKNRNFIIDTVIQINNEPIKNIHNIYQNIWAGDETNFLFDSTIFAGLQETVQERNVFTLGDVCKNLEIQKIFWSQYIFNTINSGAHDVLVLDDDLYDVHKDYILDYIENKEHVYVLLLPSQNQNIIRDILEKFRDCTSKKLFIINNGSSVESSLNIFKVDISCENVHAFYKEKILKRSVSFQDKRMDISELANNIFSFINFDALHLLLLCKDNLLTIGKSLPGLGDIEKYYLDRTLVVTEFVEVDKRVLNMNMKNDIILLFAHAGIEEFLQNNKVVGYSDITNLYLINFESINMEYNKIYLLGSEPIIQFLKGAQINMEKNFHFISVDSGKLYWHKSIGSFVSLRKHFMDKKIKDLKMSETAELLERPINLIVDDAGMGKSTYVTKFSQLVKDKNQNTWVIFVNLQNIAANLLEYINSNKVLPQDMNQILFDCNYSDSLNILETQLFRNLIINGGRFLFIFDGYDEISSECGNKFKILLQNMRLLKNVNVIITSRPFLQEQLENTLGALSHSFRPLTTDDKLEMFRKVWNKELNDGTYEIGNSLLIHVESINKFNGKSILGIPLFTYIVAVAFEDRCNAYCDSAQGVPDFPENMSIFELYEEFLDKKFIIYTNEKLNIPANRTGFEKAKSSIKLEHIRNIMLLASILFSIQHDQSILSEINLQNCEEITLERISQDVVLQNDLLASGIITNFTNNGKPYFIHQTFAEYFFAKFLISKFVDSFYDSNFVEFINSKLFNNDKYEIVLMFIDSSLKNHEQNLFKKCGELLANKFNKLIENENYKSDFLHAVYTKKNLQNVKNFVVEVFRFAYEKYEEMNPHSNKHLLPTQMKYKLLEILNGKNVDQRDQDGNTILHFLASRGEYGILSWISECNINTNAENNSQQTPTLVAIKNEKWEFLLRLLLIRLKRSRELRSSSNNLYNEMYKEICYLSKSTPNDVEDNLRNSICILSFLGESVSISCLLESVNDAHLVKLFRNRYSNFTFNITYTALHYACAVGDLATVSLLLSKGADIDCKDKDENTPLHIAAIFGHEKIVSCLTPDYKSENIVLNKAAMTAAVVPRLHANSADVNKQNKDGDTALHLAANHNAKEVVKCLLDRGAVVNTLNRNRDTALHLAASNGNADIASLLLAKQADVNARDQRHNSPLHCAASCGHVSTVSLVLRNNAEVNAINSFGNTALHSAAREGHADVVTYLLANQADVNARNHRLKTPLHCAASRGHVSIVSFFLRNNAEVNAINEFDETALHIAAREGHADVVTYLIANQADVNARDLRHRTPLHCAASSSDVSIVSFFHRNNAEVNAIDEHGDTALHDAARNGRADVVTYLLANQADVNARSQRHRTPLHFAASSGDVSTVSLLLKNKAEINAIDDFGDTALHDAARNKHADVVTYLLANEAEVNVVNNNGETAIFKSAEYHVYSGEEDDQITQILLAFGASSIDVHRNVREDAQDRDTFRQNDEKISKYLNKQCLQFDQHKEQVNSLIQDILLKLSKIP